MSSSATGGDFWQQLVSCELMQLVEHERPTR